MGLTQEKTILNSWLTIKLAQRVRDEFEPLYNRSLSNKEVLLIANNLADVLEVYLKFKVRQKYGHGAVQGQKLSVNKSS